MAGVMTTGVAWELQAPSWKALEDSFQGLQARLPDLAIEWARQGALPSALPSVGRWGLSLQHEGIGAVQSAGLVPPAAPVASLILLAGLRTDQVRVDLADDEGQSIDTLDDCPRILEMFQTDVEALRRLGAERVGLVTRKLVIGSHLPNFFF